VRFLTASVLQRAWMITDARNHSIGVCVRYHTDKTCRRKCFQYAATVPGSQHSSCNLTARLGRYGKPVEDQGYKSSDRMIQNKLPDTVCHDICQMKTLFRESVFCNFQRSSVPSRRGGKQSWETSSQQVPPHSSHIMLDRSSPG